jgi:hypothetical protein
MLTPGRTVRRKGNLMQADLPSRRRTPIRTALLLTGALTATLSTIPPAQAQPYCNNPGDISCDITKPGGTSGGGTSDGDDGGTTIPEPEDENLDENVLDLGPAEPPTEDLARTVRDSAGFPAVRVHTAPTARTYVKVRTGLWVDGFETVQTDPITLAGQTVQATATPRSVTWNLGETTITCNGPGRPNDTSCSHTYQRSSLRQPGRAYRITATVTWDVSWTCTGPGCDDTAGTLEPSTVPSEPVPLVVDEIQTNTRP